MADLEGRIREYRLWGRWYARKAQTLGADCDNIHLAADCASLAAMYYALALDAKTFGDPIPWPTKRGH